jgi:hypothetical protein
MCGFGSWIHRNHIRHRGGYDAGNPQPGDWLNYSVNISQARRYTLQVRVANGVGGGVFHFTLDGQRITPPISVPETGGYQTWRTLEVPEVPLPQGQHTLQLVMDSGSYCKRCRQLQLVLPELAPNYRMIGPRTVIAQSACFGRPMGQMDHSHFPSNPYNFCASAA